MTETDLETEGWDKVEPQQGDAVDFAVEPIVQGIYLSKKENVGPNASNMYMIMKETGETVAVWGSTVLDSRMSEIPVGLEVMIKFTGTQKGPKSPKPYKTYDVYARKPIVPPMGPKDKVGGE